MHALTAAILLTSALLARAYECSPDDPSPYYNTTTTTDDVSTTPPLTPSSPPSPDTPSTTSVPTFATSFLWPHSPLDEPGTGSPLTPTPSPSAATPSTTAEPTPLTTLIPSTLAPSLLLPDDPTPPPITVVETMSIYTTVFITVTVTVTPTPPLDPLSTQPADSLPEPASFCSGEQSATSMPLPSFLLPPSPIPPPPAPTLSLPQPQSSQPASQLAATSSFTGTESSGAAATIATATTTTPTATGKRVWLLPHFTLDTAGLLPATPIIGSGSGELPVPTSLDTAVEGGMALGADTPADAWVATAAVTATATALSPPPLPSGPLRPSGQGQPSPAPLATTQEPVSASLRKRSPALRGVERLGPGKRGTGTRGSGRKRRQACRPCGEEGKVLCRGDVAVGVCEGGCVEVGFLGRGRGNGCEDE